MFITLYYHIYIHNNNTRYAFLFLLLCLWYNRYINGVAQVVTININILCFETNFWNTTGKRYKTSVSKGRDRLLGRFGVWMCSTRTCTATAT